MGLGRIIGVAAGALALGTAFLFACGSDDPVVVATPPDGRATLDGASVPFDAGPPATPTEACRAYIQAYCDRLDECGRFSSRCADVEAYCPDYAFADGSTRTVEGALACAKVRRVQPCGELAAGFTPDCSPPGTREAGAPCQFVSQCASFDCSSQGSCGTCLPPSLDGGCVTSCNGGPGCVTCEVNSQCVSNRCVPRTPQTDAGVVCGLDAATCADASTTILKALGEPCTTRDECAVNADCTDAGHVCTLPSCE